MWEPDNKKGLAPKNWLLRNVELEKTTDSPLDSKRIKPANLQGHELCVFIGRTEAEAPILCPPDKSRLIGKDPDPGKDWRQE